MLDVDKQNEWQAFLEQRQQTEEYPVGCWLRDPKERCKIIKKAGEPITVPDNLPF